MQYYLLNVIILKLNNYVCVHTYKQKKVNK